MPRSRVIVEFPDRPAYPVRIGGGLVGQLGDDLLALGVPAGRCLLVCDSDSATRCLPLLRPPLADAGFSAVDIAVPAIAPSDAWACIAELHRALAESALADGAPLVVCAGARVSELAAFAASTFGRRLRLAVLPSSMEAALRLLAVNEIELDTGMGTPLAVSPRISFASVDTGLFDCDGVDETNRGLRELAQASLHCDDDYRQWQAENARAIASYDEEACVLALTQVLAARADAIGRDIAARIRREPRYGTA